MSRAAMLRVADVSAAYRLIGDCRDVGGNPAEWFPMALAGAARLVGGFAGTGGEGMWRRPSHPLRPITAFTSGLDEAALQCLHAYMRAQGVLADPIFRQIQCDPSRMVTCTRRDRVSDREWYRSSSFNEYRKAGGCDHQLTSVCQQSPQGAISSLCIHRPPGDRDFSARERSILAFFHAEVGRLIGHSLRSGIEPRRQPLSPRLGQTLTCLLDGDSEKQIAARLALSHSTVHQYITMLYRRFGVHSRAELMSRVIRRRDHLPHPLDRAAADFWRGGRE